MAEIRIHSIDTRVDVVDSDMLLTPELIDKLTTLVQQKLRQQGQRQMEADQDRKLVEGATR